jgi:hypothetical protein
MFNQAALLQRSGNTLKCRQYRDSEGAIAEGRRPPLHLAAEIPSLFPLRRCAGRGGLL